MANILIIGNGFDLYHNLPTRYTDFMTFAEYWDDFYKNYEPPTQGVNFSNKKIKLCEYKDGNYQKVLGENIKLTKEIVAGFAFYKGVYDETNIEFLNKNLKNNKWIQYFEKTGYKKEGWIDFEREIESVLKKVEIYFDEILPKIEEINRISEKVYISKYINSYYKEIFKLFECKDFELAPYTGDVSNIKQNVKIQDREINNQFNRPKQKKILLDKMKKELDTLIKCFRIYTMEFIERLEITKECDKIKNLGKLLVLNFNYTNTFERKYKDQLVEMCYVHGSIKDDNLVMGVSDDFIENNDYIYFQKFFQRIQKRTGIEYKDFLKKGYNVYAGITAEVYIMGHSLDKTDKGVLEKFFDEKYKVNIFYHAQWAYEEQVIKLVEMFGKERIIDAVAKKEIEFIDLNKKESKDLEPN